MCCIIHTLGIVKDYFKKVNKLTKLPIEETLLVDCKVHACVCMCEYLHYTASSHYIDHPSKGSHIVSLQAFPDTGGTIGHHCVLERKHGHQQTILEDSTN